MTDGEGDGVTGEQVSLAANDAAVTIGPVASHANGTYTATLQSSTTVHAVTITATDSAAETVGADGAPADSRASEHESDDNGHDDDRHDHHYDHHTAADDPLERRTARGRAERRCCPGFGAGARAPAGHDSVRAAVVVAECPDRFDDRCDARERDDHGGDAGGGTETGTFFDGEFILRQTRSGQLIAVLTGGSFAACSANPKKTKKTKKPKEPKKTETSKKPARIAGASKRPPKKIRSLWANVHGNFSTQGAYGSAAVSGTEWLTEDRCDGTYFRVTRHKIIVTSFKLHNHETIVSQGHSYLAPAGS